jgi:hypothetical protein
MSERKQITLAEIAQEFAQQSSEFRNFHGKLYSFIPPSPNVFFDFLATLSLKADSLPNRHPCGILVGDLSKIISHQSSLIPMITNEGQLQLQMRIDAANLPQCEYLALVSPFAAKAGTSSYVLAFQSMNFVRAYMSLYFGKLPFYSFVTEFDFDLDGKVSLASPVFRMPLYSDFFKIIDPTLSAEILSRLRLQLADYRQRMQRACNFYSIAINQVDEGFRFASYWIALEILVGSTDDAIREELVRAYGFNNKRDVDQLLLFDRISRARHNLIHRGEFGVLPAYQERLLQLYFWDIVICQINLPHRGLARMLVASGLIEEETSKATA